jgi:hypothetical protein
MDVITPSVGDDPPHVIHGIPLKIAKTTKAPGDFRLSAFGLPEPVEFPQERRVLTYVWVLAAAGVCAILAAVFRYLARRRQVLPTA